MDAALYERTGPHYRNRDRLEDQFRLAIENHLTLPIARLERLILEINERLTEPYSFEYFAPGSVNYGLLSTYRQEWVPHTYQVGRLVSTIPMAPGERRKLRISQSIKKSRTQRKFEKSVLERSASSRVTSRAELDVMSKLSTKTNFRTAGEGSYKFIVGSISSTSSFQFDQAQESSKQRRLFNEALREASEEVRQERETTVETSEETSFESEATQELSNPNNELTVTYLLYELERRYRTTTRIHRLTSVILVAMDMPAPHEITEGWLIEHAWIIRRVLLDDHFNEALEYLEDGLTADTLDVELKRSVWNKQVQITENLEMQHSRQKVLRDQRRDLLIGLQQQAATADAADDWSFGRLIKGVTTFGISEMGLPGDSDDPEVLEAARKAMEQTLEYTQEQLELLTESLENARSDLKSATDALSDAVKMQARHDTLNTQLKLHVRQNIFHYMHSIWDHRHPDEQFFSLVNLEVPFIEEGTQTYTLREPTQDELQQIRSNELGGFVRDPEGNQIRMVEYGPPTLPEIPDGDETEIPTKRLGEIADIDNPLGYKGNYIIFPLKRCSHITNFMRQSYVDDYVGLRDPAVNDDYSTEELLAFAIRARSDPNINLTDAERIGLNARNCGSPKWSCQ